MQNLFDLGTGARPQRPNDPTRPAFAGARDAGEGRVLGASDGEHARLEDEGAGDADAMRQRGGARARVLLVDDEPALARTLKLLLSELHDVTAVTTGKEALEILLGGASFDLVLCDLMMPQVTGMDIHARLEAERPEMVDKLVFMTGGAFTARATDFLRRVPNLRLEKPFSTDAVQEILDARMAPPGSSRARGTQHR